MFPPFVQSFGDQFFAVLINLIGTVTGALFTTILSALGTNIIGPLFEGLAASLGIATA